MGRTSFKIATHLIRDLREKKQLTQAEVADRIGIHLTRYQNIEWKGTTSPKTAQKLADFFAISVETLQKGLEVPDSLTYFQEIEQTIRNALEHGEPPSLHQLALNKTKVAGEIRDDAIRYLAEDIAQRIEAVQLVRNKNEIAALSELTGLSEGELLRPANAEGTWFINVFQSWQTDQGSLPAEGNTRSEVTQSAFQATRLIEEAVKDSLHAFDCSDVFVRLYQDGFWNQIEIRHPWSRQKIRIDLVRCLPDAKGLRWIKPSWRDEYLIRDPLTDWAWSNFNFICDFDGKQSPSGDIRQLRFLVTEYNQHSQGFPHPTGRMVISGDLGEMPDQTIGNFQKEGRAHYLVQSWLTRDLKYALAPFLNDYPRECWSLSGLTIDLDEGKAKDRKRPRWECYRGRKYDIKFVEQVEHDKFEPVPWRDEDRKMLENSIQKMLDDPDDRAWTNDDPRRSFAPIRGEP